MTAPTLTPQDVEEGRRLQGEATVDQGKGGIGVDPEGLARQIEWLILHADALLSAAERLPRLEAQAPKCHVCGSVATCVGKYEQNDGFAQPACDKCCGHGNEDGWCKPITSGTLAHFASTLWDRDDEIESLRAQLASSAQEKETLVMERDSARDISDRHLIARMDAEAALTAAPTPTKEPT